MAFKIPSKAAHGDCRNQRPEEQILEGMKDGFPLCCIIQYVQDGLNKETWDSALLRAVSYSETGKCNYVMCWECQERGTAYRAIAKRE